MYIFSMITKSSDWEYWNPNLEEMQEGYKELTEKLKSGKKFKAAVGFDEAGKVIKVVVVFDMKKNMQAYDFMKADCVKHELLHPVKNIEELLNTITNIIETVEERQMEKENVLVVTEDNQTKEENVGDVQVTGEEKSVDREVTVTGDEESPVSHKQSVGEEVSLDNAKMSKETALERLGGKLVDENTAIIATDSLYGNKLHIRAYIDRGCNLRKYQLFEVTNQGEELGTASCAGMFKPTEISKASSKVKDYIQNLKGKYAGCLADITRRLSVIENDRILYPSEVLKIDDCKSIEEFWERLMDWFDTHIEDIRVGVVDIKGKTHVALVQRERKTLDDIFRSVVKEVASSMNYNFVKGELCRREWLNRNKQKNCCKAQLTVGQLAKNCLGINNDKIISFAFPEEFCKRMKAAYEIITSDFEEEE